MTEAGDPGGELKPRGRIARVDAAQREATVVAIQAGNGWRPGPMWLVGPVDAESTAYLGGEQGDMRLLRWDHQTGERAPQRRHLDVVAGRYLPEALR